MVRAADHLHRHLRFYEEQSDSWRGADDDAMAVRDLREVIAAALFVYQRIMTIDAEWSDELVAAGEFPHEADARAVQDLYAKWADKAAVDLRRAESLVAKGRAVPRLDEFRAAYHEARGILSIPADRARSALQGAKEGRGRPVAEVRDELQGRLRNQG